MTIEARDIIAEWLYAYSDRHDRANFIIEALTAAGFRIIGPGEVDKASEAVADQIIGQIEERFLNWRSYRDLIDCIDCTLHDLRALKAPERVEGK